MALSKTRETQQYGLASARPAATAVQEGTIYYASDTGVASMSNGSTWDEMTVKQATFLNTGLHILDTDASHDLIIAPGSNLSADRTLTITTGDANRTLELLTSLNLKASAQSYTPAWGSTGTAPSLENGTLVGTFYQIGKFVYFNFTLTLGSSSTVGTGNWTFTIPVTAASTTAGNVLFTDAATANYVGQLLTASATTVFTLIGSTATPATGTTPFTWGTGDSLSAAGFYIAA